MRALWLSIAPALLWLPCPAAVAQEQPHATPSFAAEAWVTPKQQIEFALSPTAVSAARLAVFIGATDYSALFSRRGSRLVFAAQPLPLPSGTHEVTLYMVSPETGWQEVGRFPLRVLSPEGFEEIALDPRLAFNNKGQIAEGHTPSENAPPRDSYQDFAVNTGVQTRHVRSGWSISTQANFAGVSNRQEALRYGQLNNDAPKFDLADYLVAVERGPLKVSLGHVSFGENRHLLSGFASRGITTALRLGSIARLSAAAQNGNSIVGWSNPFGLNTSDHRVLGGSLTLNPVPARPELALEATVIDGSLRPSSGFNQGTISDAERSTGTGVRISVADRSQRIRVGAGYSRSSFVNPTDPQLSQGADIVSVARATRAARYADASVDLLRDTRLVLPTSVTLTIQHERVDPMYRNVASPVSADVLHNTVEAQGSIGPLSVQASYGRAHDNLDEIASILTTHTHMSGVSAVLPLTKVFTKSSWLPTVSYGVQRTRQFGAGIPPNSDFAASHVPDQISINRNFAVQLQRSRWRIEYQRNDSDQDNRQAGRENADFLNATNNIALSINLTASLDVTGDVGFSDADNKEQSQENHTKRLGGSLNWRATSTTVLSSAYTHTKIDDEPLVSEQTSSDLRVELSQRFPLLRLSAGSMPGQLFVRFVRQSGDALSPFTPRSSRSNWNINTGLTLGVF